MKRGSAQADRGRRRWAFLAPALIAVAILAAGAPLTWGSLRAAPDERQITLFNIHTKETTTAVFKRGGEFVPEGLAKLNYAMRDWRVDEIIDIDPDLFDLLWKLHNDLGSHEPIHLISGHRSSQTNEMLRRNRGGQAKRSQHIAGRAADVQFPDVPLERLRNSALILQKGGVGFYPRSGVPFVHIDTARVRHWPYIPPVELAQIMSGKATAATAEIRMARAEQGLPPPAPAPRLKPDIGEDEDEGEGTAAPMQLAQVLVPHGESVEQPTLRHVDAAAPRAIQVAYAEPALRPALPSLTKWGQSILEPSKPRPRDAAAPAVKHIIVASPSVEPVVAGDGAAPARIATGYAAGTATAKDGIAALLDRGTDDLRSLIAGAELFQSGGADATARDGQPLDLRPAVLTADDAASRNGPPLVTASLEPAMLRPAAADDSGAHIAGQVMFAIPTEPVMGPAPKLFAALLTAPASHHSITFEPGSSGRFVEARFAPEDAADDEAEARPGFVGRALAWIFGG